MPAAVWSLVKKRSISVLRFSAEVTENQKRRWIPFLCTLLFFSPSSSPCPLVVVVVTARTVGVVAIVGGDGAAGGWASSSL
jgi:hypothetical protein